MVGADRPDMPDIPLTEKLLADAGGWSAIKEARGILASGRVLAASYEPPNLTGRVRGAETEYRAGLRITSRTDIENTCTCPDSRRRAVICAHSLAVGLAVIKGGINPPTEGTPPKVETASPPPPASIPTAPPTPFSATEGEPCELHLILPPNFPAAWEKGAVMVVVEAALGSARKPLGALNPAQHYRCDPADLQFTAAFLRQTGGKSASMATLNRAEFLNLLGALPGHPRITFGKKQNVRVAGQGSSPSLRVERKPDGAIQLAVEGQGDGVLLIGGTAAWRFAGSTFTPVAPGLPAPYLPLLSVPITVPASAAESFLARELPALAAFFQIEGELAPPAEAEPFELPTPTFAAQFEGSLNFLNARLEAVYGERRVLLDATGAALAKFARHRAAENAALDRLRAFGFAGPDAKGDLTLKGEARILAFFAGGLPRLQRDWRVTVGERFEYVTSKVERIEPRLEITSSGEQWFDLRYDLATSSGEHFSGAEISRLLQSGQSHLRGKSGRTVVFDPALLDDFSQLLRDSSPQQKQPGLYRLDRRQAGALDAFGAENQLAIGGSGTWRKWATSTRQLDQLRPIPLGNLEEVLRPYQKQGVYWLHFLAQNGFGGILADEMGLGKTLQALAFLRTLAGQGPSLIVCPSSLIWNWQNEAAKWTPEARVLALHGSDRVDDFHKIHKSDLVITSYPLLRRDAASYQGIEFAAMLLDEAQHIKNPDSQNAQSAMTLRARHRFALTGTPVENTVRDVWSLMHFLMPGYLGQRNDFRDTFERGIQADPSGPESQRLRRRIQPFLLRRTKKNVATELPDKLEQVAYCELTKEQSEVYTSLVRATRTQLSDLAGSKDQGKARMLALTALLRLRQAACDLRLLGLETPPDPETASAKLDLLMELLEEARDGEHHVLVFSQFVTMLTGIRERLEQSGIDYCYLDGSTRDRQAQVVRFQTGQVPVFLISLKAGGTGLNLTAADTVIHFDPWWNPAVEAQATDRAHRIGQRRIVTSYKLIARNTVEEKILSLQNKKRAVIDAAIDSEQPLMQGLSMEDIAELLN
jgi:superfamily II DNA or RNA helicase